MESGQRALVALENEIFFGSDVVVEAGFRQSEFISHISERRRARAFGIKEFCSARQNSGPFRLVLRAATKG